MATQVKLKVRSKKSEKAWRTDAKGNPLNNHTIELTVEYVDDPDDPEFKDSRKFEGTSMSFSTTDQKLAEGFKIGDDYTLSLKKDK